MTSEFGKQGHTIRAAFAVGTALMLCSCAGIKYAALEKIGIPKREVMQDAVRDGVEAQRDAKETFKTTLEAFTEVVEIRDKDLEKKYRRMSKTYAASQERAEEVHDRIRKIESVSKALFREWRAELKQYSNTELRRTSEKRYKESEQAYGTMMAAMQRSAAKMDPVLRAFNDQVLFLKHNLNAAAISSIRGEVRGVESSVGDLIASMEASIAEAESFLAGL